MRAQFFASCCSLDEGASIARKFEVSESYVSQTRKRIKYSRLSPIIDNGKVLCFLCHKTYNLVFHHNHDTGGVITILCQSCNVRIKTTPLTFGESTETVPKDQTYSGESLILYFSKKNLERIKPFDTKELGILVYFGREFFETLEISPEGMEYLKTHPKFAEVLEKW